MVKKLTDEEVLRLTELKKSGNRTPEEEAEVAAFEKRVAGTILVSSSASESASASPSAEEEEVKEVK